MAMIFILVMCIILDIAETAKTTIVFKGMQSRKTISIAASLFISWSEIISITPLPSYAQIEVVPVAVREAEYEDDVEYLSLRRTQEPKALMKDLQKRLDSKSYRILGSTEDQAHQSVEKVITLKAYIDEMERALFRKQWANLEVYLYTFAEQDEDFATLIDCLFPNNDNIDASARSAMSFEAKSMFIAVENMREAAKDKRFAAAQKAYANLLLSYDRFLKAGNLYPTYDAISSTEVFFRDTPSNTLHVDRTTKIQALDRIMFIGGPDMGKLGTVVFVDNESGNAVVKLDKDGRLYQEVKETGPEYIAKTLDDNEEVDNSLPKRKSKSS